MRPNLITLVSRLVSQGDPIPASAAIGITWAADTAFEAEAAFAQLEHLLPPHDTGVTFAGLAMSLADELALLPDEFFAGWPEPATSIDREVRTSPCPVFAQAVRTALWLHTHPEHAELWELLAADCNEYVQLQNRPTPAPSAIAD